MFLKEGGGQRSENKGIRGNLDRRWEKICLEFSVTAVLAPGRESLTLQMVISIFRVKYKVFLC